MSFEIRPTGRTERKKKWKGEKAEKRRPLARETLSKALADGNKALQAGEVSNVLIIEDAEPRGVEK